MSERPDEYPEWAIRDQEDINNVSTKLPPENAKRQEGWKLFEKPPYNIQNWWMNLVYLWVQYFDDELINSKNTTDGDGVDLIDRENSLVTLYAVDTVTPANYIHAVGYRGTGSPTLNVIDSNVLTLGAASGATQPIGGGDAANIIVTVRMEKLV